MRGSAMGATILAVAILAALAAGLANLCVSHLRLSARSDSALQATNLARSAVAAGIARVAEDPEFGTPDGPADSSVTIETPEGQGFLCFSREAAEARDFSYSTNNIGHTEATVGADGTSISPDTVHLVGRGVCNGVERRVEAVVKVPSYPWAVAANGKLEIISGATVGALPAGVWPPIEDKLEPADLVANSKDLNAITLGGSSHVLGDVETPGSVIRNGAGVIIDGQVREGGDPTDIPRMRPETYDPQRRNLSFDNLDNLDLASLSTPTSAGVDTGGGGISPNNVGSGGSPAPVVSTRPPTLPPASSPEGVYCSVGRRVAQVTFRWTAD